MRWGRHPVKLEECTVLQCLNDLWMCIFINNVLFVYLHKKKVLCVRIFRLNLCIAAGNCGRVDSNPLAVLVPFFFFFVGGGGGVCFCSNR